jgi:protein MSS2
MFVASLEQVIRPGMARFTSTTTTRPALASILPKKRTLNRILFDNDSRLTYSKFIPVLESIYSNLDDPQAIRLPKYVKSYDLMVFKSVLSTIRTTTNTINNNLLDLENELVEQAAELGDNDAISILAFETIDTRLSDKSKVSDDDYKHANKLIKDLSEMKHPLTFKLAGDLAFKQKYYDQARDYWLQFIDLESDTITASHVYSNLGLYYFSYAETPDLSLAKKYFLKSIRFGELDKHIIKSHYYLGQIYVLVEPKLAKYHWEISASRGLKESFPSLGFLEMNVFQNYSKSIEWFKLGVEASQDVTCMIGQFDCYMFLQDFKGAHDILTKMITINEKIKQVDAKRLQIPKEVEESMKLNQYLLKTFFNTRQYELQELPGKLA